MHNGGCCWRIAGSVCSDRVVARFVAADFGAKDWLIGAEVHFIGFGVSATVDLAEEAYGSGSMSGTGRSG